MIICGVLFLALSLSPSSSLHSPRSRNARTHYVRPGAPSPLRLDNMAWDAEDLGNSMIRREGPPLNTYRGPKKGRKVKDYDVKVLGLDKLKSLELDESLENYLALDAQDKQKNDKQPVGFKVVSINDFDNDRQKSKLSNHKKVKLVQSLSPPQNFFQKYYPNKILLEKKYNIGNSNLHATKYTNVYGSNRKPKPKSIFDQNGMMYLSKPKDVEGRKLTHLINKVMEVKDRQEKHGGLRQPKNEFTPDEIKQIRVIAQAIDEEDREGDDNNELDQLVLRELYQRAANQPLPEDDQPHIVVAQMSPKTKQIEEIILPKSLRLQDIVGLQVIDDGQNVLKNDITQLITQVLHQKTLDNDKDVDHADIDINQKEEALKLIARALQESQPDVKPGTAPEEKVDHQFNFEDLVA